MSSSAVAVPAVLPVPREAAWTGRRVRAAGDGAEEVVVDGRRAGGAEGYRLEVEEGRIRIWAGGSAGEFYARQTLAQVRAQSPEGWLPEGWVEDVPAFAERGYYLDISRGRVPRLAMLKRKVRMLAQLKFNQLYLYFEHPFRFAFDPDIAGDGDAFSAEDVRELDAACREVQVELVPSFSCFGHLGRVLSLPAYRALAEVEFPAENWAAATWKQRLRGATLDAQQPESRELLRRMLDEFLLCFSSRRFHMCGDETYDLGRRRGVRGAAELAALYVRHVEWVREQAARHGKSLQLWGDMCRHHPAALEGLSREIEIMDWAYFPSNAIDGGRFFRGYGHPVAVAPSVRAFGAVFPAAGEARAVMARHAREGLAAGAGGYVLTDWGDGGHFAMPPCSVHGLAWGAQMAWNPAGGTGAAAEAEVTRAFSRWAFGTDDTAPADGFEAAGGLPPSLTVWPMTPMGGIPAGCTAPAAPCSPEAARAIAGRMEAVAHLFSTLPPGGCLDGEDCAQLALACGFLEFAAQWAAGEDPKRLRERLDALEKAYAGHWLQESQPRGLVEMHDRGFMPIRRRL